MSALQCGLPEDAFESAADWCCAGRHGGAHLRKELFQMRVPGFTAAKSLYTSDQSYRLLAGASARAAEYNLSFVSTMGCILPAASAISPAIAIAVGYFTS